MRKHGLNQHGIEELEERYNELMLKFKNELLKEGFNEDAAKLMREVLELIYKYDLNNQKELICEDKLINDLESIGIDWWGKEALKRVYASGLKTRKDFNRAIEIAGKIGLVLLDDKKDEKEHLPIYNGWIINE